MENYSNPPKIEDFGLKNYDLNDPRYREFEEAFRQFTYGERLVELGFPPRHSFKNVKIEESPKIWQESLLKIESRIGKGLLCALVGSRGCGKTQMAVSIVKRKFNIPKPSVRFSTALQLIRDVRSTWRKGSVESEDQAISRFENPKLLIIDEFSEIKGDDLDGQLFTNLIDTRYNNLLDTIIIGNIQAADVPRAVGPSIISRMNECGGIIELKGESFRK